MEDGPWTTYGYCDFEHIEDQGPGDYTVGVTATCGCPEGFNMLDGGDVIWNTGTVYNPPTCECSNGSPLVDCEVEAGDPTEPEDPEEPEDPSNGPDTTVTTSLSLTCPTSVQRGNSAQCTLTAEPATATLADVEWRALLFDIEPGQSGGQVWSGEMGVFTEIEVEGEFAGPGQVLRPFWLQNEIEVDARGWSFSGHMNGQQAALGEGDACFGSNTLGLMFGTDCEVSADSLFTPARWQHGHTRHSPSGGPNEGVWYVEGVTTKLELRTQILRLFRSDGDVYPMVGDSVLVDLCDGQAQTIHSANTGCGSGNEFGILVAFIWDHEQDHMNRALTEAEEPENDLHARLDSLVTVGFGAEANLEDDVEEIYSDIHLRIHTAAQCAHTQVDSFLIWYSDGSGWGPAYIKVNHC